LQAPQLGRPKDFFRLESLFDLYLVDWPGGSWQNTLKIVGVILGIYLFAIYLASIFWAYRDIRLRTRDPISQLVSVLLVVVFFLPGIWIYMILRPRFTLVELYERSLEEEALLQELEDQKACPNCRRRVDDQYIVCPTCRMQLREPCLNCGRALSHAWLACPYCGSDKAPALATPRRSYVAEPYGDYGGYYELEGAEGDAWQQAPAAAAAAALEGQPQKRRKAPAADKSGNGQVPPEFETKPGESRPRPLRDALAKATGKLTNGNKSAVPASDAKAASAADTPPKTGTERPPVRLGLSTNPDSAGSKDAGPKATTGRPPAGQGSDPASRDGAKPAEPAAKATSERPSVRLGLDTSKKPADSTEPEKQS
jgi:RNA polymerase subunit RPABC4/transcription elongation factor Spt4